MLESARGKWEEGMAVGFSFGLAAWFSGGVAALQAGQDRDEMSLNPIRKMQSQKNIKNEG